MVPSALGKISSLLKNTDIKSHEMSEGQSSGYGHYDFGARSQSVTHASTLGDLELILEENSTPKPIDKKKLK